MHRCCWSDAWIQFYTVCHCYYWAVQQRNSHNELLHIFFNKSSKLHQTHQTFVNTFVTLYHFHIVNILILERKMLCCQWFFFSFTSFLKYIYHTIKLKSYKLPSLNSIAKASGWSWSQHHHRNRIHSVTHTCTLVLLAWQCTFVVQW